LSLLKKLDGPRLRLRRSSSGIITVKATLLVEWLFAFILEIDVVVDCFWRNVDFRVPRRL